MGSREGRGRRRHRARPVLARPSERHVAHVPVAPRERGRVDRHRRHAVRDCGRRVRLRRRGVVLRLGRCGDEDERGPGRGHGHRACVRGLVAADRLDRFGAREAAVGSEAASERLRVRGWM